MVGVISFISSRTPAIPAVFVSDGAGAAVLEGGTHPGFIGAAFQADGAYASGWGILAGVHSNPQASSL